MADTTPAPVEQAKASLTEAGQASISIGYLRAFLTVLVLAHHAVLAYAPFAPPPAASLTAEPRWWPAFPVVDAARWAGFGTLVGFNDIFFMALMFFLSGLFVWPSLARRGGGAFLRGRLLRLGLPFAVAAAVVAPLAYYPTYLATGARGGLAGFGREWLALGSWPAGPAWFIWLLLAFDVLAALLLWRLPSRRAGGRGGPAGGALARVWEGVSRRPAASFGLLVAVSAAVYIPLVLTVGPFAWTAWGPFSFQTSRLLHYLVYFFAGVGAGALGLGRGLLAPAGRLARRWPLWLGAALAAFGLAIILFSIAVASPRSPRLWGTIASLAFVVSCAASTFACLALFLRHARRPVKVWDSLRDNAYGMYLIHYAFVSWLQYLLLPAGLPGAAKGSIVFLGAVLLSWGATAALRRVPAVAKVI